MTNVDVTALLEEARRWPSSDSWASPSAVDLLARLADALEQASQPVTDEQVEAAGPVLYEHWGDWEEGDWWAMGCREAVRSALEAAWKAGR